MASTNSNDRPYFRQSTSELVATAEKAISMSDIEEFSLCVAELRRRKKSVEALKSLESLASGSNLIAVGEIEIAYTVARRFSVATSGTRLVYLLLFREQKRNHSSRWGFYVGQTGKSRQERFEEHARGYKAAPSLRGNELWPLNRCAAHLEFMSNQDADLVEKKLYEGLISVGLNAKGGH